MFGWVRSNCAFSFLIAAAWPPRTSWSQTSSVTVARFDVGWVPAAPSPASASRATPAASPTASLGTLLSFMHAPLPMLFARSPGRARRVHPRGARARTRRARPGDRANSIGKGACMNERRVPKLAVGLAAGVALLALAGLGAAGTQPTSKRATFTLLVWDQEVRGGQAAAIKKLNADFQKKYPSIKINRVAKSFTDLQATLKLAASGPNPPDVVEANNGYSSMGPLVKAKLLLSLNSYASRYGWRGRYSTGILKMNQFTADAKSFGTGNLYGMPMTGEVVGVFYNKAKLRKLGLKVPTTFAAFDQAVTKAKQGGETPIQFGNLDKWPGIHEYEELMLQNVSKTYARNFIFGTGGGKTHFDSKGSIAAATKLQAWAKAGAFTDGYAGLGYDPSWQAFGKGTGVFLISGSWLTADLKKALGKDVGFFLLPPPAGKSLSTLGGEGLPW